MFTIAADSLIALVSSIYLPIPEMLSEPSKVANVPAIPETSQMHQITKLKKKQVQIRSPYNYFFKLFHNKNYFVYRNDKDLIFCDQEVKNLDETAFPRRYKVYDDKKMKEWFWFLFY